jgi:hypothetical protein
MIKWPDGSTDVWQGAIASNVKTEDPNTHAEISYTTVTLQEDKRTEHTAPTKILCPWCDAFEPVGPIGVERIEAHKAADHPTELARLKAASK